MSELNVTRIQHGQSNTPANNFTTTAEANNGTMKLARGNPGATTQDIITVDASGVVDHPQGLKIAGTSGQRMMLMAAKATTSGTFVDFSPADGTGIPSWAKKVTVMFNGARTSGTSSWLVQFGSGAVQSTGYDGSCGYFGSATGTGSNTTAGFPLYWDTATDTRHGAVQFQLLSNTTWVAGPANSVLLRAAARYFGVTAGTVTLSGTLDRIRLTTVNGTDTFCAGSVSLLIEGY